MSIAETDQELLTAFKAGDADAFEQLYDRHAPALLTVLLNILGDRQEAEDELQETFVAFAEQAQRSESIDNLRAYLVAAARNRALNRRRGRTRRQDFDGRYEILTQLRETDNAESLSSAELQERLERLNSVLSRLSAAEREVVLLHTQADLSFREMAEILDTPQGTLATRYRTALVRLREWFSV